MNPNREKILLTYKFLIKTHEELLTRTINKEEGPVHLKDVAKRITDKMGIGRIGNRIFDHIKESARYGHNQNWFLFKQ